MPDLERLRRLGIWLPFLVIGLLFGLLEVYELYLDYSLDFPFPHWTSHAAIFVLVMGMIATGAYLFSHFMFGIIRQKEQVILRRNQELSALHAVGAAINESLDLDAVLNRALDTVLEVTGAESGEIFLQEEGAGELVMRAFRGMYPEAFQEIPRFKLDGGFPGLVALTGAPLVVHGLLEDPRFVRRGVKQAGFQSYAGLALKSKGKVVGVMGIFAMDPRRLKSEDVDLLAALGNQIGIAIENASLYAQVKEMSIEEERQRIAREMHDGLAQELGYLYLKMGEIEAHPSTSPIQEEIRLMKKLTAEAYEEVRQAIFGLKMVSQDVGLVPALTEYLREFSDQTCIGVELQVADGGIAQLSPHVEIQLIRIVQEALANVRKHARAGCGWVILKMEDGKVKIIVQDDGRGFDLTQATTRLGRACFGLQTMRERAESVGGAFTVESQPGEGTQVIVWLPVGGDEAASWKL